MHNAGILTFYDTTNYGGLFQIYVLEKRAIRINPKENISIVGNDCPEVKRREKISIAKFKSLKELAKNCLLYRLNIFFEFYRINRYEWEIAKDEIYI